MKHAMKNYFFKSWFVLVLFISLTACDKSKVVNRAPDLTGSVISLNQAIESPTISLLSNNGQLAIPSYAPLIILAREELKKQLQHKGYLQLSLTKRLILENPGVVEASDKALQDQINTDFNPLIFHVNSLYTNSNIKEENLHVFEFKSGKIEEILTAELSKTFESGGGFTSLEGFNLQYNEKAPDYPDIVFRQTSLPEKGVKNMHPGPPIDITYIYNIKKQMYLLP